MALPDIKDAGALAGFVVWGWPYHGIISGGSIGSTGQAHPQPSFNDSWLIDTGLPPIVRSPNDLLADAALNHEWRNYALIPGGHVYGTYIGAEKFIHIDVDGAQWLIALSYSFPASQTLSITASITRFGLFNSGNPLPDLTSIQKTVSVVCAEIELSNAVATYDTRSAELQDVDTNGSRALVGVMLHVGSSIDMFSVVTVSLGGSGGADGNGLTFGAAESIGQSGLTASTTVPTQIESYEQNWGAGVRCTYNCSYNDAVSNGFCTIAPAGNYTRQYEMVIEPVNTSYPTYYHWRDPETFVARYAYFGSDGAIKAIRLWHGYTVTRTSTPTSAWEFPVTSSLENCDDTAGAPAPSAYRDIDYLRVEESGWMLLENDVVIDRLMWRQTDTEQQRWIGSGSPLTYETISSSSVIESQGSLAAYLPNSQWVANSGAAIAGGFRSMENSYYSDTAYLNNTSVIIGLHKMPGKATAFLVITPTASAYGLAVTALGPLTVGLPPAYTTQFAWQRKTLEHTFASSALAYV